MTDDITQGTAAGDSASADLPQTGAPGAQPDQTASAGADSQTGLTAAPSQPNTAESTTPPPSQPAGGQSTDWMRQAPPELRSILEKDPNELKRMIGRYHSWGKRESELGQVRQELERLRAEAQQREQAQKASPYTKRHPEYEQTKQRVSRAESLIRAQRALGLNPENPEDKARLAALAREYRVTPDDMKAHQEAEAYREQMLTRLQEDPDGFFQDREERLLARVEEMLVQREQAQQVQANTAAWINDPANAQMIQAHAPEIVQMVDPNIPYRERAAFAGKLLSELDALKKQLGKQVEQASQAGAQRALAQMPAPGASKAAAGGSPRVTDAREYVQKVLKILPSDHRYAEKLIEVNAQIRAGAL